MFSQEDIEKNKVLAILMGFFNIIAFAGFFATDWKQSAFIKHRCNQTLIVLCILIARNVVVYLPIGSLASMLSSALYVVYLIAYIINLVNTFKLNDACLPGTDSIKIIK